MLIHYLRYTVLVLVFSSNTLYAQHMVEIVGGQLHYGTITHLSQEKITINGLDSTIRTFNRAKISGVSCYVLDEKLYKVNFALLNPYLIKNLYLKEVLRLEVDSPANNGKPAATQSKILDIRNNHVIYILYVDSRYRIDSVSTDLVSNEDEFKFEQYPFNFERIKEAQVRFDTTFIEGSITELNDVNITIELLDPDGTSISRTIPIGQVNAIGYANGQIYRIDKYAIKRKSKFQGRIVKYPNMKVLLTQSLLNGNSISASKATEGSFTNALRRDILRLNSISVGTRIEFSEKWDAQMLIGRTWSNPAVFGETYSQRDLVNYQSYSWQTVYQMRLNMYSGEIGYTYDRIRLGIGVNFAENRSKIEWDETAFSNSSGSLGQDGRWTYGTVRGAARIGFQGSISYVYKVKDYLSIEPIFTYRKINFYNDAVVDIIRGTHRGQAYFPGYGSIDEFVSSYAEQNNKFNSVSLSIRVGFMIF